MSPTIKATLATESRPGAHDAFGGFHYTFAPECLDHFTEQAVGLPVEVNFDGEPIGSVTAAERTADGVALTIDLRDDIAERIASPAFVASDDEWNADYTERVIRMADLKGIGMTDD